MKKTGNLILFVGFALLVGCSSSGTSDGEAGAEQVISQPDSKTKEHDHEHSQEKDSSPSAEPAFNGFKPVGGLPDGFTWERIQGADSVTWFGAHENPKVPRIELFIGDGIVSSEIESAYDSPQSLLGQEVVWRVGTLQGKPYAEVWMEYFHGEGHEKISVRASISGPWPEENTALIDTLSSVKLEIRKEPPAA